MKKMILISTLAMAGISMPLFAADDQNGTGEIDGYTLVWQDLFDADELNPLRWNVEVNNSGGGNNELQYYTDRPENVRLGDDGEGNHCLILTARREEYKNRHFTSGRVNSKNLIAFTHGKVEAAIKLPSTANGLWPAFWMMGNDFDQVGWPKCGETDICEFGHADGIRNNTQDRYFNGACHWGQSWPNASYANSTTRSYSLQDGEFHIFTCIWDDAEVKMYVDLDKQPVQTPYFRMTIPQNAPDDQWSPGNYFHKLNFILFNLAIGGNFPGIHDAEGITALNESNGQQASMYINYVKIYQKGGAGEDTYFVDEGDMKTSAISSAAESTAAVSVNDNQITIPFDGSMQIYDLAGRMLSRCEGRKMSIRHLPAGVYMLSAQFQNRNITLKIKK